MESKTYYKIIRNLNSGDYGVIIVKSPSHQITTRQVKGEDGKTLKFDTTEAIRDYVRSLSDSDDIEEISDLRPLIKKNREVYKYAIKKKNEEAKAKREAKKKKRAEQLTKEGGEDKTITKVKSPTLRFKPLNGISILQRPSGKNKLNGLAHTGLPKNNEPKDVKLKGHDKDLPGNQQLKSK